MKLTKEQRELLIRKVGDEIKNKYDAKVNEWIASKEGKKETKQWLNDSYPGITEIIDLLKKNNYRANIYGNKNSVVISGNTTEESIIKTNYPFANKFGTNYMDHNQRKTLNDYLLFQTMKSKDFDPEVLIKELTALL